MMNKKTTLKLLNYRRMQNKIEKFYLSYIFNYCQLTINISLILMKLKKLNFVDIKVILLVFINLVVERS